MRIVNFPEKRKICAVIASRANYGRMKSLLLAMQQDERIELSIIVGASALLEKFGNVKELIESDGFSIDAEVHFMLEGSSPLTMAKSTGIGLMELPTIFNILRPHIVLTHADRFETMATAVAATYMNIPLAHTQGGELTGSIDESVRHAITKMAHIHFPATEDACRRIVKMGENPDLVFNTGCPAIDTIRDIELALPNDFFKKAGGTGRILDTGKPYLVLIQHPVTTEFESARKQITESLEAVAKTGMQTVVLWPNIDAGSDSVSKGIRVFRENHSSELPFQYVKNLPTEDYARLIKNCACLLGNSSSALREGAFLGVPAVNIGTRQSFRSRGNNVTDAGYDREEIFKMVKYQIEHGPYESDPLFGDGTAGVKISDILASIPSLNLQKTFHEVQNV